MKKLLLFTSQLLIAGILFSQNLTFDWANLRGSTGTDYIYGIETDAQGNIYNVGIYQNAANDFDPDTSSSAITTIPFSTSNDYSVFIQKLDPAGNLLWVKTLDSPSSTQQRVSDIVMAPNGDLIISGSFIGAIDFDMGSGTANMVSNNSGTNRDGYILRLTQNGDFVWVKTFGGNNSSSDVTHFLNVDVDSQGNIFTVGYFEGSVDVDPSGVFQMMYADYDREALIIKLNSSGNYQWAHEVGAPPTFSGNLEQMARSVLVDSDDNVWFIADIEGEVEYSGFPGTNNVVQPGSTGVGILKVSNATGVPLVNNDILYANSNTCVGYDLAKDVNDNIYITGWFNGTLTSTTYGNSYNCNFVYETFFTAKYDKNINLKWVTTLGAQTDAQTSRNYSVAYQPSTGLITVGGFIRGDNFNIASQTFYNPYLPGNSINRMTHVIGYDTLGQFVWAGVMGAHHTYNQIEEIHVDQNDNMYLGGYVQSNTNKLDPFGGPATDLPLVGGSGRDAFLVKLSNSTSTVTEFVNNSQVSIYPNPTKDYINIEQQLIVNNILIRDVSGKLVRSLQNYSNVIDVSSLTSGVYFIQIQTEEGTYNQKFVKE